MDDDPPKLDLSLGGTEQKDTGFGGIGEWNSSSWNTASNWNFSGADTGGTDIADSFSKSTKDTAMNSEDSGAWSFGGNKKNKKKTTTSGFDFGNFGALEETKEEDTTAANTKAADGDDWGAGFTAAGNAGKKDKKSKKKNAFEDIPNDPDANAIGTALAEPEPLAEDSFGAWGTTSTKKDKKKGKKTEDSMPPPNPPASEAAVEAAAVDEWGGFGNKKDKKKGKKITEEEPALTVVPEPEPEPDAGWGSFAKKDKKKSKKESDKIEEPTPTVSQDPEPELDSGWGFNKKDKKKGKKGENVEESAATIAPEAEFEAESAWGFSNKKDKKKGKKETDKVEESAVTAIPEPEVEAETVWGFSNKKDKRKGKKDAEKTTEPGVVGVPDPEADFSWGSLGAKDKKVNKIPWDEPGKEDQKAEMAPEPDFTTEIGWGAIGSKKDNKKGKKDVTDTVKEPEHEPIVDEKPNITRSGSKKDKKGKKSLVSEVKEDPVVAVESEAATVAGSAAADDDLVNGWATDKKKDKKSKRNSLASSTKEEAPPPPPPVPDVPDIPDVSSFDNMWGSSKKDKKGKKGKVAEPEPEIIAIPEMNTPQEDIVEDDWGGSGWGFSAKDKKKREKEKEKEKNEKEEKEKKEKEEREAEEKREKESKEKDKGKDKGKVGKKGKAVVPAESSESKDLFEGSVPDIPAVEEDTWGDFGGDSWGAAKKDKKKTGKNNMAFEVPPAAPTPPAQGLTPEPEDIVEDDWGSFAPAPAKTVGKKNLKKDSKATDSTAGKKGAKDKMDEAAEQATENLLKEDAKKKEPDTPAKAARSFWGGMGATTTSKGKAGAKTEEKAKLEAPIDEEMDIAEEINNIIPKGKTDSMLSKVNTKDSDKASKASKASKGSSDAKKKGASTTDDVADEPVAGKGGKGKNGKGKGADIKDKVEEQPEDSFSLWGTSAGAAAAAATLTSTSASASASKKTTGKKAEELRKEIAKQAPTNQKSSLRKGISNEPEAPEGKAADDGDADQPATSQPLKSSIKPAMSSSKSATKSSVLQRVKEIEKEKAEKAKPADPVPPPPREAEVSSNPDKKSISTGKAKDLASSRFPSFKKDTSPPVVESKEKVSKDSVPGGFPVEASDDEFGMDELIDTSPVEKEKKPSGKKGIKSATDSKMDSKGCETPADKRPPTPPPEPKEEKPVKKERARVTKGDGGASWGLWGAAPAKKDSRKAKDDADISTPAKKEKTTAPGLSRSKSSRTAKDKDRETVKSDPKSSDSEKAKKADSRPPKSRGSSFGGLFGAPSPSRTKSVRRSSTAASAPKIASRRQSMDVDATGLPSPPADDGPETTAKAAKVMGIGSSKPGKKESSRGKEKIPGNDFLAFWEKISDPANIFGCSCARSICYR